MQTHRFSKFLFCKKLNKKNLFFLEEFLLNFLKRIGVDLKKIYFPRIELKDPKFNYNFDGNQLSAALSSKINTYEGDTVLHKFLLILAQNKQISRCS
jgi:hypothetical protein